MVYKAEGSATIARSIPMPNGTVGVSPGGQAGLADAAVLAVVRGQPTDTEIAALVTVLTYRARKGTATVAYPAGSAAAGRSVWSDRSRLMRQPVTTGAGAWKRSAAPR
jgi:acyl-CoA carboxylase epsilon subunit